MWSYSDIQIKSLYNYRKNEEKKSLSSPSTVIKMLTSLSLISANNGSTLETLDMSQLLLLGKVEYGGGPIFEVVLEC